MRARQKASQLRIFFDINEPLAQGRTSVTLQLLVLTAYNTKAHPSKRQSISGKPAPTAHLPLMLYPAKQTTRAGCFARRRTTRANPSQHLPARHI
ncbi:MAG TPA: hypothetical protein VF525_07445 [Pyrinomonadaceae bacterium]